MFTFRFTCRGVAKPFGGSNTPTVLLNPRYGPDELCFAGKTFAYSWANNQIMSKSS
jgi:hypothetical protein